MTYTFYFKDRRGTESSRYEACELNEVFKPEELAELMAGGVIQKGECEVVCGEALAEKAFKAQA